MLPRTSPTKATSRVAIVSASRQSPLEGERPTTGSDEGNSSKGIAYTEQPITRAHENWGSSVRAATGTGHGTRVGTGHRTREHFYRIGHLAATDKSTAGGKDDSGWERR